MPQLTLTGIADSARLLYTGYANAAADWHNEKSAINCQVCEAYLIKLHRLAMATAQQLPALWPNLRLVSSRAIWHARPGFDWDAAETELRQIEAAALSAESVAVKVQTPPEGPTPPANSEFTPEERAILFIQDRLKVTGKLPTKTAIAEALDVDRRTLNNWTAFKVAYAKIRRGRQQEIPRGQIADGKVEAWRESGK